MAPATTACACSPTRCRTWTGSRCRSGRPTSSRWTGRSPRRCPNRHASAAVDARSRRAQLGAGPCARGARGAAPPPGVLALGEGPGYRRFFDVNELIGVREERPDVFGHPHRRGPLGRRGRGGRSAGRPSRRPAGSRRLLRPPARPDAAGLDRRREDPGARRAPAAGVAGGRHDRVRRGGGDRSVVRRSGRSAASGRHPRRVGRTRSRGCRAGRRGQAPRPVRDAVRRPEPCDRRVPADVRVAAALPGRHSPRAPRDPPGGRRRLPGVPLLRPAVHGGRGPRPRSGGDRRVHRRHGTPGPGSRGARPVGVGPHGSAGPGGAGREGGASRASSS